MTARQKLILKALGEQGELTRQGILDNVIPGLTELDNHKTLHQSLFFMKMYGWVESTPDLPIKLYLTTEGKREYAEMYLPDPNRPVMPNIKATKRLLQILVPITIFMIGVFIWLLITRQPMPPGYKPPVYPRDSTRSMSPSGFMPEVY